MANKEIGRRVKYHNWILGKLRQTINGHGAPLMDGYSNKQIKNALDTVHKNKMNTFIKFLMNDKLLTESKRKSLVELAIQLDDKSVIALRNPVVIRYLMRLQFLTNGEYFAYNAHKPFTKQLKALGKYRQDAAMVSVLKKRINFMKNLLIKKLGSIYLSNNLYNDLENRGILSRIQYHGAMNGFVYPEELKKIMNILFPLPPHTNSTRKTAATKIQKTVRGMINRKRVKNLRNR